VNLDISIEELKKIIHGLRMSQFNYVEDNIRDEVQHMIQSLPSPEELDKVDKPNIIKNVKIDIGKIMRIIELYGKRDGEFKARYKSRTGLPPRYKVLEWRGNMNMNKAEFVKEMVKISAMADNKGNGEVAGRLIRFAKNVQSEKVQQKEAEDIIKMLKEAGFDKEAGWMNNVWQGVKNVGKGIAKDVGGFLGKQVGRYQEGVSTGKIEEVKNDMANVVKLLESVNGKAQSLNDPSLDAVKKQIQYMYGIATNAYQVIDEEESKAKVVPQEVVPQEATPQTAPQVPQAAPKATPKRTPKKV